MGLDAGVRWSATKFTGLLSRSVDELATRISVDPKALVGKTVIKRTRIAVELIVNLLAKGWTREEILDSYPNLTADDIRACLAYASEALHAERVYPLKPR